MFNNIFEESVKEKEPDILIVSDFFASDVQGGAELTTQALVDSVPSDITIKQIRCREVTLDTLQEFKDKYWIFTNIATLDFNLLPSVAANLDYSVIEYDYKFCRYRSIEKHEMIEGEACDCHESIHGKIISTFFLGARNIWWMSEAQEKRYTDRFPFLAKTESIVLSSVFSEKFFAKVNELKDNKLERKGWRVLDSQSWIKGTDDAIKYCEDNSLEYKKLSGLTHNQVLESLATAEGLVYLPVGGDTCPRLVIEAKLLGCELVLNDHVQHKDEIWFNTEDEFDTEAYLYAARERFWNGIISKMSWQPTISGYTTIFNGDKNDYPWEKCIESMLGFCDEVVVVDGGSDDGTWDKLQKLSSLEPRLKIEQSKIDWDHPRFAYHSDGKQKAYARSLCNSDFCWQMDSDEFVLPEQYGSIREMVRRFPALSDLIALPVFEFWGSMNKVRVDVNPWKWRLSRNLSHITHGIPKELRRFDENGDLYTAQGSDTCDYINNETFERIRFIAYYSEEVEKIRLMALQGDEESLDKYQDWAQNISSAIPCVYHTSWLDMERKVNFYKNFWSKFWCSQYNTPQEDTSENNMFFDKPWSQVTSEDISNISSKLSNEMGGWIFHRKINWEQKTPHITLNHECDKFLGN